MTIIAHKAKQMTVGVHIYPEVDFRASDILVGPERANAFFIYNNNGLGFNDFDIVERSIWTVNVPTFWLKRDLHLEVYHPVLQSERTMDNEATRLILDKKRREFSLAPLEATELWVKSRTWISEGERRPKLTKIYISGNYYVVINIIPSAIKSYGTAFIDKKSALEYFCRSIALGDIVESVWDNRMDGFNGSIKFESDDHNIFIILEKDGSSHRFALEFNVEPLHAR